MSTPRKWVNVAIAMQSTVGPDITITAISKASEGVVTATNTLVNGEFVVMSVQGMYQLNNRVARVKAVSGTGFTLEGIDTTGFDVFASGSAKKVTLGTMISTVTTVTPSGGEMGYVDTTTIHNAVRTQIPGTPSPIGYSLDNIWDVSDPGLIALKAACDAQSERAFKFTFGTNGSIMVFYGQVSANLSPEGQAHGLVTTKSSMTASALPTFYPS